MEVVPTAESPTVKTSCEERAILRNARNPSGHMANEGDERKFYSLSPSKFNHKHSRGVTYSADPGNEGAQSSTSVPSEGEVLGNVVDIDPTSRSYYEPINMTTVGYEDQSVANQRKINATQQLNILVLQHTAHSLQ